MSKDHNYIGVSATLGGIGGAVYGFRHPSEKSIARIAQMKPSAIDTMMEYRDSFNIDTACDAVRSEKLTLDEFDKVKTIKNAIHETCEKEQQIIEVANTPIENRTKTFRQAVKEANATRPKLWKSMFLLNKDFKEKLIELNIFDAERFNAAMDAAKAKLKPLYKELSKGAAKGLAIGIAAGVAVGAFLNRIANKD